MSEIAYPVRASDWIVHCDNGLTIAECDSGGDDIANARRIAACLNACRDISTEDLERCDCDDEWTRNWLLRQIAQDAMFNSGSAAREG